MVNEIVFKNVELVEMRGVGKKSGKEYVCFQVRIKDTIMGDIVLANNIFASDVETKLIESTKAGK